MKLAKTLAKSFLQTSYRTARPEAITSEREVFSISGPLHLTAVDWKNSHHRRSVAASLVKGVNIRERDRQKNRQGDLAQASPWWNFFQFQLKRELIDDADSTIFGAVYEYNSYTSDYNAPAPKYVIAFRGTMFKPDSWCRDVKLDVGCFFNKLHKSSRFNLAIQAVQNAVNLVGAANIWLAGHSLGSAIALFIGRNMTKKGDIIESFLFNPPFLSAPIEMIKNEKLKHGVRFASSVVKAGVAVVVKVQNMGSQENDSCSFYALSVWIPQLFLNPADHICSEFIGYFRHRKKMEEKGASKIERVATQHSVVSVISAVFGRDSEPLHLLPSANLTINLSQYPDFKRAHGIHQWWDPNFHGQSELHVFRKKMEEKGASKIERVATQHSAVSVISGVLGRDSEPLHLLPSANLTINLSQYPCFKQAHGIHQWWDPNFHGQSELHVFR